MEVPAIISAEDFEQVQAKLAKHHPKVTAARTVNSPTLTAGLAKCGADGCGSGMILRTGKSGQYRYLICDRKRTIAADACSSSPVPMKEVDDIVITTLQDQVLSPQRLSLLLEAVLDRSDSALAERREALKARKAEKTRVEGQKMRLLELVEMGELSARDPQLSERLQAHSARLAAIAVEIRSLEQQLAQPRREITDDTLARFARIVREGLRQDDPTLRRAYLRLIVDEIVVTPETITVRGSKAALEHAVFAGADGCEGVLTSIREWRARRDSNPWPSD
ncbi:hypothetical protein HJG53_06310 [Sphingomonas sp. ID1715]|nr:hypothetical protein [Sphingomonas sp. ID1715]